MRATWEGRPIAGKRTAAAPVSNPPLGPRVACALPPLRKNYRRESAAFSCPEEVDCKRRAMQSGTLYGTAG
jgi:hypothetical protein